MATEPTRHAILEDERRAAKPRSRQKRGSIGEQRAGRDVFSPALSLSWRLCGLAALLSYSAASVRVSVTIQATRTSMADSGTSATSWKSNATATVTAGGAYRGKARS